MAGKVWDVRIHKVQGQWVVETPRGKVNRETDTVRWTLESRQKGVSARFQFPAGLFVNPDRARRQTRTRPLTRHKTTHMEASGNRLSLKVDPQADRRKNPFYYAVWINDASLPHGGAFAVGGDRNPPPEVVVGP